MRFFLHLLLLPCFSLGLFSGSINGQTTHSQIGTARQIAKKNTVLLNKIHQLLLVFNETPENNSAVLVAMEKKNKRWIVVSTPITVKIGRSGFAPPEEKREGDHKSPTGFFKLGKLFCYDQVVNTRMPFIQTTTEDKWIDDPNSTDYNQYIRGLTSAKSYENLKLSSDEYKYCMVIEYNMHPVVKGFGSAIFLHLGEEKGLSPSAGCVVTTQKDMEWILNWLDPTLNPSILMGNKKVLTHFAAILKTVR